jgi:hypothetical protein
MDKHYISDSLLFDAWCWRECTPAILKRAIQQLATIGVNYTTIEADCWYGERTPEQNYELQVTPLKPAAGGKSWALNDPNREWDDRLNAYAVLCKENNIILQKQLFTQQYSGWTDEAKKERRWFDFMPWSTNTNNIFGLWPCSDFHRNYVHRAIEACLGLDNVRFSAGCELSGDATEVAQFHLDVLSIPFMRNIPLTSLMLGIDRAESFVQPPDFGQFCEKCKGLFDALWDQALGGNRKETIFDRVWQYAHGIHRINLSEAMDTFIYYHGDKSTQWEVSTDGDWKGDSPVDFIEHQGRIDRKPSRAQMYALSAKLFDAFNRPIVIDVFHEGQYDGETGRPVMERLIDLDKFGLLDNTRGVVDAYEERFGQLENHGKPVDPYVPPIDPEEPEEPEYPVIPVKPDFNLWGWIKNRIGWIVLLIVLIVSMILIF